MGLHMIAHMRIYYIDTYVANDHAIPLEKIHTYLRTVTYVASRAVRLLEQLQLHVIVVL